MEVHQPSSRFVDSVFGDFVRQDFVATDGTTLTNLNEFVAAARPDYGSEAADPRRFLLVGDGITAAAQMNADEDFIYGTPAPAAIKVRLLKFLLLSDKAPLFWYFFYVAVCQLI